MTEYKMIINYLNRKPLVVEIPDFLSSEEVQEVLNKNFKFSRSKGFNFSTGTSNEVSERTSETFFDLQDNLKLIRKKIQFFASMFIKGIDIQLGNLELLQLTKYQDNQEYVAHYDYFNHEDTPEFRIENDRVATFLIYLTEDFEKGHTSFPKLDLMIKPKIGKALYFDYYYDHSTNEMTLHSGDSPLNGTKIIISCWIRREPYVKAHTNTVLLEKN